MNVLYALLLVAACNLDSSDGKPPCPNKFCPQDMECEFGVQLDGMGCVTCRCNPPPETASTSCTWWPCPNPPSCPMGVKFDFRGCPTCTCIDLKCPQLECPDVMCENGFLLDENKCRTCRCK